MMNFVWSISTLSNLRRWGNFLTPSGFNFMYSSEQIRQFFGDHKVFSLLRTNVVHSTFHEVGYFEERSEVL